MFNCLPSTTLPSLFAVPKVNTVPVFTYLPKSFRPLQITHTHQRHQPFQYLRKKYDRTRIRMFIFHPILVQVAVFFQLDELPPQFFRSKLASQFFITVKINRQLVLIQNLKQLNEIISLQELKSN